MLKDVMGILTCNMESPTVKFKPLAWTLWHFANKLPVVPIRLMKGGDCCERLKNNIFVTDRQMHAWCIPYQYGRCFEDYIISKIYFDRSGYGSIQTTCQDAKKRAQSIAINDVRDWFKKNVEQKKQLRGQNSFIPPYPFYEFQFHLFLYHQWYT